MSMKKFVILNKVCVFFDHIIYNIQYICQTFFCTYIDTPEFIYNNYGLISYAMLISLVAGAHLTNLPNLQDNLKINVNKSHSHNKNFSQSAVSWSLSSKVFSLLTHRHRYW